MARGIETGRLLVWRQLNRKGGSDDSGQDWCFRTGVAVWGQRVVDPAVAHEYGNDLQRAAEGGGAAAGDQPERGDAGDGDVEFSRRQHRRFRDDGAGYLCGDEVAAGCHDVDRGGADAAVWRGA